MAKNAVIHSQVHIGQPENMEGFGLKVDIQIEGIEDDELIQAGHKVERVSIFEFREWLSVGISLGLPLQPGIGARRSRERVQSAVAQPMYSDYR